jgi:hypothetical protein
LHLGYFVDFCELLLKRYEYFAVGVCQIGLVQVVGHLLKIQFHDVSSHLFFLISLLFTQINLERDITTEIKAGNM